MLSERQSQILRRVVERYVDDGRPVGSRALANRPGIGWSASTVRAELASLEEEGFLTQIRDGVSTVDLFGLRDTA